MEWKHTLGASGTESGEGAWHLSPGTAPLPVPEGFWQHRGILKPAECSEHPLLTCARTPRGAGSSLLKHFTFTQITLLRHFEFLQQKSHRSCKWEKNLIIVSTLINLPSSLSSQCPLLGGFSSLPPMEFHHTSGSALHLQHLPGDFDQLCSIPDRGKGAHSDPLKKPLLPLEMRFGKCLYS